ncbi:hypothetical protein [Streptomyces mirabilis]|uniref:hypothetical protein n=1 Tax=Streptomyces mirabilis TaxID=68239 RepID=UPI0036461FEA
MFGHLFSPAELRAVFRRLGYDLDDIWRRPWSTTRSTPFLKGHGDDRRGEQHGGLHPRLGHVSEVGDLPGWPPGDVAGGQPDGEVVGNVVDAGRSDDLVFTAARIAADDLMAAFVPDSHLAQACRKHIRPLARSLYRSKSSSMCR